MRPPDESSISSSGYALMNILHVSALLQACRRSFWGVLNTHGCKNWWWVKPWPHRATCKERRAEYSRRVPLASSEKGYTGGRQRLSAAGTYVFDV